MQKLNYGAFISAIFSSFGTKKGKKRLHNQLMTIMKEAYISGFGNPELEFTTENSTSIFFYYTGDRDIPDEIRAYCAKITDTSVIAESIKEDILCAISSGNTSLLRSEMITIIKDDQSLKSINNISKEEFLNGASSMLIENLLAEVFLHVLKYIDRDRQNETMNMPNVEPEPKTIKEECKEAICEQIDQFIHSNVYLESDIKDVTFFINDNLKQYYKKIITRSVLVNPSSEDLHYSMSTVAASSELPQGDRLKLVREKYRSKLKITVNKMPLKDYLLQLGELYPDQYGCYLDIGDDWDIYSLFSITERADSDGLVTDTKFSLDFPLDKNMEKHDVKVEFTTYMPLIIGRLGGAVRIGYPCKHLEHKYAVRFNRPDAWEISFYVFEPFYMTSNTLNPRKKRAFSIDRIDKQTAFVKMNYLLLPGSGYAYRILMKELVDGDSFTPEFLSKAGLLDEEVEYGDFLE